MGTKRPLEEAIEFIENAVELESFKTFYHSAVCPEGKLTAGTQVVFRDSDNIEWLLADTNEGWKRWDFDALRGYIYAAWVRRHGEH